MVHLPKPLISGTHFSLFIPQSLAPAQKKHWLRFDVQTIIHFTARTEGGAEKKKEVADLSWIESKFERNRKFDDASLTPSTALYGRRVRQTDIIAVR